MAALPYIQFYVSDYMSDTAHLTLEEHGAYLMLIFNYWQTGKPIVVKRIPRILHISDEHWQKLKPEIEHMFNECSTGVQHAVWKHPRIDADLEQVNLSIQQKKQAAQASVRSRAAKKASAKALNGKGNSAVAKRSLNGRLTKEGNTRLTNRDTDTDTDTESKNPCELRSLVAEVFKHWVKVMGKNPGLTKLNAKRKAKVEARLREKYTVEQIKQAIDGCKLSAHHMGDNDQGKAYNDLELICRDGAKLEGFIENLDGPPRGSTPSGAGMMPGAGT